MEGLGRCRKEEGKGEQSGQEQRRGNRKGSREGQKIGRIKERRWSEICIINSIFFSPIYVVLCYKFILLIV